MNSFKRFLVEVDEEQIKKIGKEINQISKKELANLPFNNIFGDKTRIVVPLLDEKSVELTDKLTELGYYDVDLDDGTLKSKVKTERGEKERTERIGGVLRKLSQQNKVFADDLRWFEKNMGKKRDLGVSVVISRHPIDILRMGDHPEMNKSCHAPSGSHFHCAIQEAKTGGAVAYAVKNSDLNKVDLNSKEIFADNKRGVKGIEPLERVRLRRFTDGIRDVLVPEVRTYGIHISGFTDTIENWARRVQRGMQDLDYEKFDLKGGSYQDTKAYEIWNKLFGTEHYGNKKSLDEPEETRKMGDTLEQRANQSRAGHTYKHFSIYHSVEGEEEPYLYYDAGTCFDFNKNKFAKIPTAEEVALFKKGSFGEVIREDIGFYGIEQIDISERGGIVRFCFSIRQQDAMSDNMINNFESFLDEIDEFDLEYDKYYANLTKILLEHGYLQQETHSYNFKHFQMEGNEIFSKESMWIGDLQGLTSMRDIQFDKEKDRLTATYTMAPNFLGIFPNFMTDQNLVITYQSDLIHAGKILDDYSEEKPIAQRIKVMLNLVFPATSKDIQIVKFLDDRWEMFEKRGVTYWNQFKHSLISKGTLPKKEPIRLPKSQPSFKFPN